MKKVLIDANVFLAYLDQNDNSSQHNAAVTFFNKVKRGEVNAIIPSLGIIEVNVGVEKKKREKIAKFIDFARFPRFDIFNVDTKFIVEIENSGLYNFLPKNKNKKFVRAADFVYVAIALLRDIPVLTFDQPLKDFLSSIGQVQVVNSAEDL